MIRLLKNHLTELENSALTAFPEEACALLLGTWVGENAQITQVCLSDNMSEDDKTTSFEIDPSLYIRLQKQARAGGAEVIGVWHSHPNGMPAPSKTDHMRSIEKNWVWLITSVNGGKAQTKGYLSGSDTPNIFQEISISVVD
ncbi:Mov34/MPN/PAD-1 family protein [Kordiimonas sp. SCSIO 12610]|uniref:Mov34/MPN/PAD-1 family protein n=1 Tax=Kordiimonas sp. SCSIO 12610 TaxID=2829597 RepID=UPI00210C3C4A|nr:M67 family metallopeptidase [Kordiimonas sp. SCSIO 12610]UTW56468.1 M67 family metallopeptidase [Kordiimonas sp. SCSIO 12610]